jgi:hypothetical protein
VHKIPNKKVMLLVSPVQCGPSYRYFLDSGFRRNDGHPLHLVIPAKAGIQES